MLKSGFPSDSETAPESTSQITGCPFCNFAECKRNQCLFFVNHPKTERECMIQALFRLGSHNRFYLYFILKKVLRIPTF